MTANILCHASSTWTIRQRLRGGVLKGARCIRPYAAAELLALPLGLATLAEAPSPTSTRTTPLHCPARHRNNNSKSPTEKDALGHSLNYSRFRGMTANILCHASSTWTIRQRLRGGVLKGARCISPYAAAELLALPLGLATLAEAPSPTSTRTTPLHCPDLPWYRAQLGVHLDNEQMSFNRTGQLQRPRLTWMASVVCRPLSLTNQLLRTSQLSWNLAPKSSTLILRGQLSLVSTRVCKVSVEKGGGLDYQSPIARFPCELPPQQCALGTPRQAGSVS